ncbi:DUF2975 domain-containing protein [Proteinivorax hydrogeniformans]|uniref:DUF2975 domain-containing protein n=1 Tax=Proteinivorax hydrogeniformans TaxID=1826727 RepID=A0AAU8HW84_9FIRM
MEHKLAAKTLNFLLNILWFIVIASFVTSVGFGIATLSLTISLKGIVGVLFFVIAHLIILKIIWELRKIIKTVLKKEPFTDQNITGFKNIGIFAIFMAFLTLLRDIFNIFVDYPKINLLAYLGEGYQSRMGIFMFLILGCMAFVLSEIFSVAKSIKEENDLTV